MRWYVLLLRICRLLFHKRCERQIHVPRVLFKNTDMAFEINERRALVVELAARASPGRALPPFPLRKSLFLIEVAFTAGLGSVVTLDVERRRIEESYDTARTLVNTVEFDASLLAVAA